MPQEELTNNRPGNYSSWHRNSLPGWCFNTDGDWFEQRKKNDDEIVAVAYIETIQIPEGSLPIDYPVWASKRSLAMQINNSMNVSSFFVWHYPSCQIFFVQNVNRSDYVMMRENEYKSFIKNL